MALRDVKEYYYTMLGQYVEAKNDILDFNKALQDGYVTEDRLEQVKEYVDRLGDNLARIQYIMYLFELPNRKDKKAKAQRANKGLEAYFAEKGADLASLSDENRSIMADLRADLKKLADK